MGSCPTRQDYFADVAARSWALQPAPVGAAPETTDPCCIEDVRIRRT